MENASDLHFAIIERLKTLAAENATVARPISIDDRHMLSLLELGLAMAEGAEVVRGPVRRGGRGVGAGGAVKASPIAVLVIDKGEIRLERIGR